MSPARAEAVNESTDVMKSEINPNEQDSRSLHAALDVEESALKECWRMLPEDARLEMCRDSFNIGFRLGWTADCMRTHTEKTMKTLEEQIVETVATGIGEAIKARIGSGYGDNPLNKLIDSVVASRADKLRTMIEEAVDGALFGDFRASIQEACSHKLARVIVSKMEGEIEKRYVELRASPEMRAKITLAIDRELRGLVAVGEKA